MGESLSTAKILNLEDRIAKGNDHDLLKADQLKEKETAQNLKRKRIREEAPLIQSFFDNQFTTEDRTQIAHSGLGKV